MKSLKFRYSNIILALAVGFASTALWTGGQGAFANETAPAAENSPVDGSSTVEGLPVQTATKTGTIRFGVGFHSTRDVFSSGYASKRGLQSSLQIGYEWYLSEAMGLESQLMYRSAKTIYEQSYGTWTYTFRHLSTPVALKGYFGSWKENSLFAKAGVIGNFNASRKVEYEDGYDGSYNYTLTGKDGIGGRNLSVLGMVGIGKTFVVDEFISITPELLWMRGLTSQERTTKVYESNYVLLLNVSI